MGWVLFVVCVFIACKKDGGRGHIETMDVNILNTEASALRARIEVNTKQTTNIVIRYRETGEHVFLYTTRSVGKREHVVPLFQLKENTIYELEVGMVENDNAEPIFKGGYTFTTAAIPGWVKEFYKEEENVLNDPLPGYYLFASMSAPGCLYIVNNRGQLVWYQITPDVVKSVHLTPRNTILSLQDNNGTPFGDGNIVLEQHLYGDTLFYLQHGQRGFDKWVHHDLIRNSRGGIVAITNVFDGNKVPGDGLVKWSSSGDKMWEWTTYDVQEELDPALREQPWINSIDIDHDGHYLLSLRALDQIWKVNASTGAVMWKLGKGGDIQMDEEAVFLRQHYAHRMENGEIMLFDNGDKSRPYSRVLSFIVDEEKRVAKTSIDIRLPAQYYSPIMGSAKQLPDGNMLVASSSTNRALKLDPSGHVLWELNTQSGIYRIEYLPTLFE